MKVEANQSSWICQEDTDATARRWDGIKTCGKEVQVFSRYQCSSTVQQFLAPLSLDCGVRGCPTCGPRRALEAVRKYEEALERLGPVVIARVKAKDQGTLDDALPKFAKRKVGAALLGTTLGFAGVDVDGGYVNYVVPEDRIDLIQAASEGWHDLGGTEVTVERTFYRNRPLMAAAKAYIEAARSLAVAVYRHEVEEGGIEPKQAIATAGGWLKKNILGMAKEKYFKERAGHQGDKPFRRRGIFTC